MSSELTRGRVLFAAFVAIVLSTWLFWPALGMGFHYDDYIHLSIVQGDGVLPQDGPLEMFAFAEPVPDRMGPIQGDYLPWWRGEDLVIRFLRPLAALTYYLDHALFGANPVAFHAMNLAWYAGVILGAVLLYATLARRSERGVAPVLLAGLVFGIASEHVGNAAWLFGRYSLVGAVFCPLALLAYDRWRSEGSRAALAWTLVLLAAGLAASEAPIALCGFFLAYELSLARDGLGARVRGILPVVLLALAWVALYAGAGYGTKNSPWYLDPLDDPAEFIAVGLGRHLPENAVRLVLPIGLELPLSASALPIVVLAVLAVGAFRDRTTRFALLGSFLSLIPISGALPTQRVLLLPSMGFAWVVAAFVVDTVGAVRRRPLHPWNAPRIVLVLLLFFGLAKEPEVVRTRIAFPTHVAHAIRARALALDVPEGRPEGVRVLMVTVPSPVEVLYQPLVRLQLGKGWPEGNWGLSTCNGDHAFERTGARSFRLRVAPENPVGFLGPVVGPFRDDVRVDVGTVMRTGVLEVTVAETDEAGLVRALDVALDLALDDPNVWLVTWEDQAWKRLAPPPVGESVTIRTRHASP